MRTGDLLFFALPFILTVQAAAAPVRRFVRRHWPWATVGYGRLRLGRGQIRAIAAIDRAPLVRRLAREPDMTMAEAEIAVAEYQAFLAIAAAHRGQSVSPASPLCDEAWHTHILFTEAYDRDMRRIFGRPFHHRPAAGPEDAGLAEPQRRTSMTLHSLRGLARWQGLAAARAARSLTPDQPLTTAAMLGLLVADGPAAFASLAALHATTPVPAGSADSTGSTSCGSGCSGGHGSGCSGGSSGCCGSGCCGGSG